MKRCLPFLLLFCASPLRAATPTSAQNMVCHPNSLTLGTINDIQFNLPNPAKAGNTIFVWGVTNNSPVTNISVSDDKSDTYTLKINRIAATRTVTIFAAPNVTAGAQQILVTQSTGGSQNQYCAAEFYNVDTSATLDGTSSASITSGTSLACGSFTTATAGDLVLDFTYVDSFSANPVTTNFTGQGGSWLKILEDDSSFSAAQYEVQASAGAVNPTMTIASAVTQAIVVCAAFKSASSGSGPAAGIRVNSFVVENFSEKNAVPNATTIPFNFPCTGNSLALQWNGLDAQRMTSVSDSNSNTWTVHTKQASPAANEDVIWATADSVTCNSTERITVTHFATPSGPDPNIPVMAAYDISSSGGFDLTAQTNGTAAFSSGNVTGASITPSTSNGVLLAYINEQNDTVTSTTTGTFLSIVFNHTAPNLNELGQIDQDAGYWLFYNPDTTTRTPVFTYTNTSGSNIGGWWEQGLAFKFQSAACTPTLMLMGVGRCG
jgi:hypothetical protein